MAEACRLTSEVFGIEGTAQPLTSERDQNFLISGSGNDRFVLKIAGAGEDPNALELQNSALLAIAEHDPELPAPRLRAGRDGELMHQASRDGRAHAVRLFTYLPGTPVSRLPPARNLQRATGRVAARLDRALAQVPRPAFEAEQVWDLKRAADVRPFVRFIEDAEHRRQVEMVFARFEQHVLPILPNLRSQVVHGDLNDNNILAAPDAPARVTGIIDFGDMVNAPLITDVAIAAAHQIYRDADPLAAGGALVGAYDSILPLGADELDVLPDLIATRLAVRMTMMARRDRDRTGNLHFDRGVDAAIWQTIALLATQDRPSTARIFHDACGQPVSP